jgi:hypothetical protein
MDGTKDGPALAMPGASDGQIQIAMPSHDDGIESILSMRAQAAPSKMYSFKSTERRLW